MFDPGNCIGGKEHKIREFLLRDTAPTPDQMEAATNMIAAGPMQQSNVDEIIETLRNQEYCVVCVRCGKSFPIKGN